MTHPLSPVRALLVASVLASVCGVSAWVYAAANNPAEGIPFTGRLELNGADVDGDTNMTFTLGDAAALNGNTHVMTRTVNVDSGRFSVVLGAQNALPAWVRDANSLFVAIDVEGTRLGAPQQVFATFQAVSAHESVNAEFADEATVASQADGAFTVQNSNFGNANGTSQLVLQGTLNDTARLHHTENNNAATLYVYSSDDWDVAADNDHIVFGEPGSTARHRFTANGDATISRDLTVGGTLNVGLVYTSCDYTNGANHDDCSCPAGTVLLSGGTHGAGGVSLRESRAIDTTTWRVACLDSNGNRANCNRIDITCARLGN